MSDYLTSFLSLFLSNENQLILMFLSAFLSATILPANSEIIFSTLAYQQSLISNSSQSLFWLFIVATIGNSLGSLTTYWIAQFFPSPKITEQSARSARVAWQFSQKYGVYVLLLSWLPIIGDLFCGIAGWLRFNLWKSLCFITLGKAVRYGVLLWGIYAFIGE